MIAGFVIQAGDPQTKTRSGDFDGIGTGGPAMGSRSSPAEGLNYIQYSVAMATTHRRTAASSSSRWSTSPGRLDMFYTIFGQVISAPTSSTPSARCR